MGPHVTERLSAYMDEELGEADRAQVDAHLVGCPACARRLEELRAVEAAARALPLEAPDGYFEAFSGRVRRRLEPVRARRRGYVPAWAFAAAAALVLAVLTPRVLHQPRAAMAPPAPTPTRPAAGIPAPPPPTGAERDSALSDSARSGPRAVAPLPAKENARRRLEEPLRAQAPQPAPAPEARATPATPAREYSRNTADAPQAGYAAPPPVMDQVQEAPAPGEPQAKMEDESGAAARDEETKARRDKGAVGGVVGGPRARAERTPASDGHFQLLLGKTASSAAEARALRDAWRAFAREEGTGPRADEARVRAIEAGAEAWRKGRDDRDRAEAQRDGREYLARPDAHQRDRVRAALRTLVP